MASDLRTHLIGLLLLNSPSTVQAMEKDHLPHLPERVLDCVDFPAFAQLLEDTVRTTCPQHEQEKFVVHFEGLLGLWVSDQRALSGR